MIDWLWLESSDDPLAKYQQEGMGHQGRTVYSTGFRKAKQAFDRMPLNRLHHYVIRHKRRPGSP